ncbi:DUF5134 domain-containing protein [Streptomyces sp. MUM 178J]|uniref:DUF5134 domain-containing protein n=1 Tax=Streptomyces sp. MUM 178J TaxID=2791991 RepID=UPI001F03B55E|nr:DUF5134 domain-containing protein [Streptomyces sp. MUM 178J]WRQ78229.1 DUF5134 domain-containing protein [Streptomyces sp. MUM 178J]
MYGASAVGWLLMALCGATGGYCLLRMRRCAGAARKAAGSEALMGIGMAAMAAPTAVFTPPEWTWAVYALVFGAVALPALRPAVRSTHHLHHLVGSLAMVYMATAHPVAAGTSGHGAHAVGGHPAGGAPLLTGLLLVYYTVYVLRSGARLIPAPAAAGVATPPSVAWAARPELALACRVSMGMAMLTMLLAL